jgi:hypothetical protein
MPTTSGQPWNLPSPTLPEAPDGPGDIGDLAGSVHTALGRAYPCLSTNRPGHTEGLLIFETDSNRLLYSDGTNWNLLFGDMPRGKYSFAAQAPASGAVITIPSAGGSVLYDNDNMFGTADRLTINTAGWYTFTVRCPWANNATGYRAVLLRKNGATYFLDDYRQASNGQVTIQYVTSDPVQMAAADYVQVVVVQSSGVALSVGGAINGRSTELTAQFLHGW